MTGHAVVSANVTYTEREGNDRWLIRELGDSGNFECQCGLKIAGPLDHVRMLMDVHTKGG